jgi:neopullulanase
MRQFRFAISFLGLLICLQAAPSVLKVEPPNWWVGHTQNPLQILLTGSGLQGASVTADRKLGKVEIRQVSDNGHYAFLYLRIAPGARPGKYRFQVNNASGKTDFEFTLNPSLDRRGRFQGFTPNDVVYLLAPDRFSNGDTANDSLPESGQPADRSSNRAYHGGDFKGLRNHLGYLKELGITGIWVLPVPKNSSKSDTPYHGYHAVDFYSVEPHFGSMKDFQDLVNEAHRMGIKVMQDQVANHCGPAHPWVADPPTKTWFHGLNDSPKLRNNFDTPSLADPYARPKRRSVPLTGWFNSRLPDFDQTDPLLSDYLIQNTLWWIGMSGVDGVRQDTYPYVDRPFWEKWQSAIDRQFPGFFVVGEITSRTPAVLSFFEGGTRRGGVDTRLPSMLDFPLYRNIRSVFAQGGPMTDVVDILAQDSLYKRPEQLVAFIGNHDGGRFLTAAGGDISRLMMAQTFTLTTNRIPHLYYGDEIAMGKNDKDTGDGARADFPGGFPGDPVNAFVREGRAGDAGIVFDFLQGLLQFRKQHPALRGGKLVNLLVEANRYAFLRSAPSESVIVLLNRSGARDAIELDLSDLEFPEGTKFQAWPAGKPDVSLSNGRLKIVQPGEIQLYWAARK